MDSLNDPRMLLSATTIAELEQNFDAIGEDSPALLAETLTAVRGPLTCSARLRWSLPSCSS